MWSSSDGAVPGQHSLRRRRKSATRVSPREQHARLILDRYEAEILPHSRWRAARGGDACTTAIEHRRHRAARAFRPRVGMGAHAGSAVGVLPRRPPLERSLGGHQPECAGGPPGPPRIRAEGSRRHPARRALACRPAQLRHLPASVPNGRRGLSASAAPDSHVDAQRRAGHGVRRRFAALSDGERLRRLAGASRRIPCLHGPEHRVDA